jgi:hypothetical protein
LNDEFQKKFVVIRSNVYFAPALFANRFHRRTLCSEFSPPTLFHQLFHRLLRLTSEIQTEVDDLMSGVQGRDVIGVQVRLEDRVGFQERRVGSFFNCVESVGMKYNDSAVYIASDTEGLKKRAQVLFGSRLFRSGRQTRRFSETGVKSALIDLIVLSKCRELVLTPFSTFGAVAAGIGNIVPHFITREEGFCIKDIRSEPKFHYWHALSLAHIPGLGSSDMLNQDDSFM